MSSAPQFAPSDSPNQLTIEQLAAESGMSVRNLRAHQARLGPMASEALMAIFQRRLSAQLEGAVEEITRWVAGRTANRAGE